MTKDELRAILTGWGYEIVHDRIRITSAVSGEHSIDLGDGYYAELEPHPKGQDSDSWGIYKKLQFSADRIGYATIFEYPETGHAVGDINLGQKSEHRGKGLGRKLVPKLVDYYGSLTSDPQGNTNSAAVKMWESLKAEKIPTDKNTKGFVYCLKKSS